MYLSICTWNINILRKIIEIIEQSLILTVVQTFIRGVNSLFRMEISYRVRPKFHLKKRKQIYTLKFDLFISIRPWLTLCTPQISYQSSRKMNCIVHYGEKQHIFATL